MFYNLHWGLILTFIYVLVGGPELRCNNACDCKGYAYCIGENIPVCRLRTTGELAGKKYCACDSCEDDSSNDDSDSDAGDRREFLWTIDFMD